MKMEKKLFTIDFHTHVNEKKVKPLEYWKKVEEIELNGVGVTEHADWKPKEAFEKLFLTKPKKVLMIPGMEVNTSKGHFLVFSENTEIYEIEGLYKKKIEPLELLEIAKKEKLLVSISHPWGYNQDSAAYQFGELNLMKFVRNEFVGVESYSGILGQLSNSLYDSKWVTKPFNFFKKIETNAIAKKIWLSKIGKTITEKIDKRREDIIKRCIKAIELGGLAKFVTAGSDAHFPHMIGSGIMKIKISANKEITAKLILEAIQDKKNVAWYGPLIKEVSPGVFEKVGSGLKRKEIKAGLKYIAKSFASKAKGKIQIRRKKKN